MKRGSFVFVLFAMLVPAGKSSASEFSWENLLHAWIKLNSDFNYSKAQADAYMQVFRPQVWKEVMNDEFKRKEARDATIVLMKKRVEEFDLKEEIILHTTLPVGEYNFDTGAFPIENMRDSNYWYPNSRYAEHLPGNLSVFFSNTKSFDTLKLTKEAAAAFVKERNEKYRGDRNLSVTIKFRLTKLRSRDTEFLAEIQSLTLYRDPKKSEALATLTKPSVKDEK